MKAALMFAFAGGFGFGLFSGSFLATPERIVQYVPVHDVAANSGNPSCPKINSGQILKSSERELLALSVVLHCKYNPRSKVNDPVM